MLVLVLPLGLCATLMAAMTRAPAPSPPALSESVLHQTSKDLPRTQNGHGRPRGARCTTSTSSAAKAVQTELEAAIQSGQRSYTVPASSVPYCFGNSSLVVEGANHLDLSLGGNAIIFSHPHGILVRDSVGVTLHGGGPATPAQISYDPPTTAQGEIVSTWGGSSKHAGSTHARIALDTRFNGPDALVPGAQCQLWKSDGNMYPQFGSCKQVKCGDGGPPGVCISTPGSFPKGTPVSFVLYRSGYTVTLVNATACSVVDVHILAAPFMAITEFVGQGANVYQRVRVGWMPGRPYVPFLRDGALPQPRLSSNADVFHSYGTRKGPRISNCTFEYAADDFFNVHNEIQVAFQFNNTDIDGRHTLYLIDPHLPVDQVGKEIGARVPRTVYGTVSSLDYASEGDSLSFGLSKIPCEGHVGSCQWSNFTDPVLAGGAAVIASIRRSTDPVVLEQAAQTLQRFCAGVPCDNSPSTFVYAVQMQQPVTIPVGGCLASVNEMSASGSVIEDCIFRHNNANLGRTKSADSVIRRNVFRNAAMCNLEVVPLQQYLEGPWRIRNVSIVNNQFKDCPASSIKHGALASVSSSNNTFHGSILAK